MIRERTSAGLAAARAEGRIGGRRKKLDPVQRREIAENVLSGGKIGAEMAWLYNIIAPTVSRIVAQHRWSAIAHWRCENRAGEEGNANFEKAALKTRR
jgi:DNA invertase Pin-like site-specific DNA recombinase